MSTNNKITLSSRTQELMTTILSENMDTYMYSQLYYTKKHLNEVVKISLPQAWLGLGNF